VFSLSLSLSLSLSFLLFLTIVTMNSLTPLKVKEGSVNLSGDGAVRQGPPSVIALRRDYSIVLSLTVPPTAYVWYEITA
jgi:hypothetical protein